MREGKVPIDTASELKNLGGILSTRQAIYCGVGGSVIYAYIGPLWNLLFGIVGLIPTLITCVIFALPVVVLVVIFAFLKVEKHHMFRDQYFLIKWQRKSQVGLWRKGK